MVSLVTQYVKMATFSRSVKFACDQISLVDRYPGL